MSAAILLARQNIGLTVSWVPAGAAISADDKPAARRARLPFQPGYFASPLEWYWPVLLSSRAGSTVLCEGPSHRVAIKLNH